MFSKVKRSFHASVAFARRHWLALGAFAGSAAYVAGTAIAQATEYKVEYDKLTGAAETNFGEAVTSILVILGLIIGVLLGIRFVKKMLRA